MLRQPETTQPITGRDASAYSARNGRSLRVLHVINRLDVGGTEYGVLKLVMGLNEGIFEQRICTTRGFDPVLARRRGLEDKVFVAGGAEAGRQFPLLRLAWLMKAYQPHIVHSRNWGAIEAIPAARLARVPVAIHSEHGYEMEMLAGLSRRQRLLRRAIYAMADAVFAVTKDLGGYHAGQVGISPEKIQVIYNGVDARRFAPRPEIRSAVRQQLGLPVDSFVVGTVGRLVRLKDHSTLLKAAAVSARHGVNARVVLAGSGPELPQLQREVEGSAELARRVLFLGASENIPDVLNAMDAFVLSSLCEGMSNTLLEAMASGLPVIATRAGGNPELVKEGSSGWLFEPGDVGGLASRLEQLARNSALRAQLGAAARERAVARFSLERMLGNYRNLYLELARQRGVWSSA